jgi:hypothetical protein
MVLPEIINWLQVLSILLILPTVVSFLVIIFMKNDYLQKILETRTLCFFSDRCYDWIGCMKWCSWHIIGKLHYSGFYLVRFQIHLSCYHHENGQLLKHDNELKLTLYHILHDWSHIQFDHKCSQDKSSLKNHCMVFNICNESLAKCDRNHIM